MLAAELQEQLTILWPELRVHGIAEDGVSALRLIDQFEPDVVFLDIQMPLLSGLEVARQLGHRAHIVFITAYDAHAIPAFEAGAIDYVLKPVSTARLAATVRRVQERVTEPPIRLGQVLEQLSQQRQEPKRFLQWINAQRGSSMRLITVDEICYFKSDHKYTLVVTHDSESLIKKTIRELQEELDPALFWQVHRSTVVNVSFIDSVVRDDHGGMQLKIKQRSETIPVSESYNHLFKTM